MCLLIGQGQGSPASRIPDVMLVWPTPPPFFQGVKGNVLWTTNPSIFLLLGSVLQLLYCAPAHVLLVVAPVSS